MDQYPIWLYFLILIPIIYYVLVYKKFPQQPIPSDDKKKKTLDNHTDDTVNTLSESLLASLPLSKNIIKLYRGEIDDEVIKEECIDLQYGQPYDILSLDKEVQDKYNFDRYKPILSSSEHNIAYDTKLGGYYRYDMEQGFEPQDFCYTWDGLFIRDILFWWESEISNDRIIHIGNYFGLKYSKEILESIERETNSKGFQTQELIKDWEQKILVQINGIIR